VPETAPKKTAWCVLKFGGTSVASARNWKHIHAIVTERLDSGQHLLIVHSALAGISDQLDALLQAITPEQSAKIQRNISRQHLALADELDIDGPTLLQAPLALLKRLCEGVQLLGETSPRIQARIMALGEIMATHLGAAYLARQLGTGRVDWLDIRHHLQCDGNAHRSDRQGYLNAHLHHRSDPTLSHALAKHAPVIVTQGFIARHHDGGTALLGRGGSDTSAAVLAARLEASSLEVWTDVAGIFSADPKRVPQARLLHHLSYREAQEIASTGARVMHPRALRPIRDAGVKTWIRCTHRPHLAGTLISAQAHGHGQLKAISVRKPVTLISLETVQMWQQAGFLADAFACFKRHNISIDLLSTSASTVTLSLDQPLPLEARQLEQLEADLSNLCRVKIITQCAAVSLVGRHIRTILHQLGPAFELFSEQPVHVLTQAANDLNLTVVVDADQADRLALQLHDLLISGQQDEQLFGPTWEQLSSPSTAGDKLPDAWWRQGRERLLQLAAESSPRYVYSASTLKAAASQLLTLRHIDAVFYAVKANWHADILRLFHSMGLGFECVSPGELQHVLALFPDISRDRLLFTCSFAPREEYALAREAGVTITLDNDYPLRAWPEMFAGAEVILRLDLGMGRGHHGHVKTGGILSKFGIPLDTLTSVARHADQAGAKVIGLHSHAGSGVFDSRHWRDTAARLAQIAENFPHVRLLNLGGGLGVPQTSDRPPLDLAGLDTLLGAVKSACPQFALWLEPGRFLVARAGVLLATVTQTKRKGKMQYAGVNTGMNALIRPALYGAYHEIVNLTRLGEPSAEPVSIVGPICETGDRLGMDRSLPECHQGDVLLIANAGAYGRSMASHYNRRPPPEETFDDEL